MFVNDFIINGVGHGEVAGMMQDVRYDPGVLRPYFDDRGRGCVRVLTGKRDKQGKPIRETRLVRDLIANGANQLAANATTLTKQQWVTLTNRVIQVARERLRAWGDLSSVSSFGGFDGMGTMALEYQTMSDAGEALVDFDAMTEGRTDTPLTALQGLPLPITHSDFWFSERALAISRRNGTPLNVAMAERAGRRVAEKIEQTVIGTVSGLALGSQSSGVAGLPYVRKAQVYGYLNFPARMTKTDITAPTTGGWNGKVLVDEFLECLELLRSEQFYGPFMVYHSTDWDAVLDNDYNYTGGVADKTLRQRLRDIDGIRDIRRLDLLPSTTNPWTLIFVQMSSDVVQAVNGMDMTTVQWPSMGGMRTNFKVMCIQVPLIMADYNDRTGILQATTS